jgi:hypothetical protein
MSFDNFSDNLRRLFCTPSLMKGEDPDLYAELYNRVEEVVQPQDVWDQMIVADITNHFWEQQRYRRYTPPQSLMPSPTFADSSTIIGGEFTKIRAECQYYHGNTASKREQEHQRYDESLHGYSPSAGDENGFEQCHRRFANARK